MIKVYGMAVSGNCWKAGTILRLTGKKFEWIETDGNSGATRRPDFLALNPNGKVPVVVLDDGAVITEVERHPGAFRRGHAVAAAAGAAAHPRAGMAVLRAVPATSPTSPSPAIFCPISRRPTGLPSGWRSAGSVGRRHCP